MQTAPPDGAYLLNGHVLVREHEYEVRFIDTSGHWAFARSKERKKEVVILGGIWLHMHVTAFGFELLICFIFFFFFSFFWFLCYDYQRIGFVVMRQKELCCLRCNVCHVTFLF